jgi:glycosyltransferase involved in cell wall biosynthesis
MRVCILSQGRLEFAGGVESYVRSLSSWLSRQNHDVILISRRLFGAKAANPRNNQMSDNRTLRVPQTIYMIGLLILSLIAVLRVISENKKRRMDVIHGIVDFGYAGFAGIFASKIIGAPLCVSLHSHRKFLLNRYLKSMPSRLMLTFDYIVEKFVYSRSDVIIALSSNLENYIRSFDIKPRKVIKIPVAIQLDTFKEFDESKENSNRRRDWKNKMIIGYVGRLEREKNLFTLLQAFEEISKRRQNTYLFLVGDGSLKDQLKTYAETTNVSKEVCFLGTQHNIPNWLQMFDVFVLPSFTEGMPFALLEAMAAGKAIIASDIPAIREVVEDGKEACLFNPYNPKQLKDAMLKLCNDPKLRKRLGENAKQKAKQYDANDVFPKILQVYHEISR